MLNCVNLHHSSINFYIIIVIITCSETTKSNEAVESSKEPMEEHSEENDLPPYILFLDVVHEYLGR